MINCAVIMGRITADPELKTTNSGLSVTSFTVAVDRSFVKAGEQRQADFINVVAWRGTADFVTRYFHKGSMIAVQGSIQTRSYTDKQGNKRIAFEIVADNVSFCGSKSDSGQASCSAPADKTETQTEKQSEPTGYFSTAGMNDFDTLDVSDDDLPF